MNRDTYIFKRLREHYDFIKDKYEIVGIFLQGSQNYGLDIYDDDYKSDIDSKAIVLPTLDDIVYNRAPISTTLVLDNNEHIDVKDVRIMFDSFTKQNINYIEILFTKFKILNPKYKAAMCKLFENNEKIARMDIIRALNCQTGMSKQKLVALKHPYPTIIDKIERFGYDPKQLHHILRMNDFAKKYIAGKSYLECLIPDDVEFLIQVKKGVLSLKDAEKVAVNTENETYEICKKAISELENPQIDSECMELLTETSANLIKQHLREIMQPDVELAPAPFVAKNVFVTSDNHFYHDNIIEFEHRPFKNVDEMNEKMIEYWNDVVTNDDLVFILGDFSFGNGRQTNHLLKRLNGKKVLIVGNHDYYLNAKVFDKSLFLNIINCEKVKIFDTTVYMCHYPFASNDNKAIQLYGHLHTNSADNIHRCDDSLLPLNSYNVGADLHDFRPINIKDVILKVKARLENNLVEPLAEYRDACLKIQQVCKNHNKNLTLQQCYDLWETYSSEYMDAGFMMIDIYTDDGIWENIQKVLED